MEAGVTQITVTLIHLIRKHTLLTIPDLGSANFEDLVLIREVFSPGHTVEAPLNMIVA